MKSQDKKLAPPTQATGACLNSGGCRALGSLSHGSQKPGQVSTHGEPPRPRWEERKDHTGETSLSSDWSILYCPGKLFILLVVHRDQWIIQNYAGSAALTLIKTRLSLCIPSCIHKSQVIYIIFWPRGLLAFYGPFLIRVCQPENLFALKVPFQSLVPLSECTN